MLDNLLEIVTEWLEIRGCEVVIDYEDDILYYEDDEGHFIEFCKIDETILQRKIDEYNMDEIGIIE